MQTTDQVAGEARLALAADNILHARDYAKREGFLLSTSCFSYDEATMIAAALRSDPARGAKEMRERAAQAVEALDGRDLFHNEEPMLGQIAAAIRALPLHPAKDDGGGR